MIPGVPGDVPDMGVNFKLGMSLANYREAVQFALAGGIVSSESIGMTLKGVSELSFGEGEMADVAGTSSSVGGHYGLVGGSLDFADSGSISGSVSTGIGLELNANRQNVGVIGIELTPGEGYAPISISPIIQGSGCSNIQC